MDNFEYLEYLPQKMSRKEYITQKYGDMYNLNRFDHPWRYDEKRPELIVKRIIKKYIGLSFDKAFSEYCKKVEIQYQKLFLDEFNTKYYSPNYILDNNKNIQINPNKYKREKKVIIFKSFDYTYGYFDTITGTLLTPEEWYRKRGYKIRFIKITLTGYEKIFNSKKDKEYKKLMAEKKQLIKLNNKLLKRKEKEKQYSFISEKNLLIY